MKKYILPIILVVVFAFYILLNSRSSDTAVTTPPPVADNTTTTPIDTPTPTTTPTSTPVTIGTGNSGTYKNGTYTGPTTDAFYGPMQVAAVVSGGKITAVNILKYPNDQGESRLINSNSNPILIREAIAAQSANVDIVSGATQSSEAFQQSLAAALAKAKN